MGERRGNFIRLVECGTPDGHVNQDGMKTVIQMSSEQNQSKGPLPSPSRYVDERYLNQGLRELKEGEYP